jgi:hypothetical protein
MRKKLLWIFFGLAVAVWCISPIPPSSQHAGAYQYDSHLMYCRTRSACLHEVGHRLDQIAGFPSQSEEFERALQMYLYVEIRKPVLSEMPVLIMELTYRSNGEMSETKREIYAYLFAWANGKPENMPDGLRPFYDWDSASRLIKILNDDQQIYWLN